MPDWPALLIFNLTLLAALASPGPAMLIAIRNTVQGGIGAGIKTGLGLAAVAALWTTAALFGLGAIFAIVPWLYNALKLAGACYLVWIGIGMIRSASTPFESDRRAIVSRHPARDGAMVNLLNPKSVLFAGAVLVVIFPGGLSTTGGALIIANHFVVEVLAYSALAFGFSRPLITSGYVRMKALLDRIAGAVMAALGLRLLLDRS